MNYDEIQIALKNVVYQMSEKGIVNPSTSLDITIAGCALWLTCSKDSLVKINGNRMHMASGSGPSEKIANALKLISEMPDASEAALKGYMQDLSDANEKARKAGVDDDLIAPTRAHIQSIYENLLTHEAAE